MMEGMSVKFERICKYDEMYENAKMIHWPKDRDVRISRSGWKYEFKTRRRLKEEEEEEEENETKQKTSLVDCLIVWM
jgi:hypothetical protein